MTARESIALVILMFTILGSLGTMVAIARMSWSSYYYVRVGDFVNATRVPLEIGIEEIKGNLTPSAIFMEILLTIVGSVIGAILYALGMKR